MLLKLVGKIAYFLRQDYSVCSPNLNSVCKPPKPDWFFQFSQESFLVNFVLQLMMAVS